MECFSVQSFTDVITLSEAVIAYGRVSKRMCFSVSNTRKLTKVKTEKFGISQSQLSAILKRYKNYNSKRKPLKWAGVFHYYNVSSQQRVRRQDWNRSKRNWVKYEWKQNVRNNSLSECSPKDNFNVDETGLFFKCLPNQTRAFKNYPRFFGKNKLQPCQWQLLVSRPVDFVAPARRVR